MCAGLFYRMGVPTRLTLNKGLVGRALNAVRLEMVQPTTGKASRQMATLTTPIVAPSLPQQQQLSPSPRFTKQQPPCLQLSRSAPRFPSNDSGRFLSSGGSRKRRVPEWRSLSTRTSDGVSSRGSRAEGPGGEDNSCWRCESSISLREFFCVCGAAQLFDGRLDYFDMFECPPSVFLDLKDLETKFKDMQRAFHPVSTVSLRDRLHTTAALLSVVVPQQSTTTVQQ